MDLPFRCYVLDNENRPVEVDVVTWGKWLEQMENRLIGMTEITSECLVSTVFIGIDHRIYGKGPPILFETMIFGGPLDESQWRYASWDDAKTGHEMAVAKARKAIGQKIKGEVR